MVGIIHLKLVSTGNGTDQIASSFTNASSAVKCSEISLLQNSNQSLSGFFSDPIDLNGNSKFPFLGIVLKSDCSTETASCQVLFKVTEALFEFQLVAGEALGIPEEKIQDVSVAFDSANGIQFPINSEWFVIPENYGSRGSHGSGFIFNTHCGSSIAPYKDGNLTMLNGKTIPYADIKRPLSEMANPKAIERLKSALRQMMTNQK
ncbi:hypothetical protein [Chromobacterium sp. ATCC 53434]|uniref:hypothetical protein n=1 Tax=Chromobacterium sp. (strain ATCC 53434 / SC 14030) TaxID=2059672 RepID=UPI0013052375|nr:hypothetical protein [Chromobacterium sp. ATCC 53434]